MRKELVRKLWIFYLNLRIPSKHLINQMEANPLHLTYIDLLLSPSDLLKVQQYLSKTPILKQIYCPFYLRALCIFPPEICPHAHGFQDLKYLPPYLRHSSEDFYHINADQTLKFKAKDLPIYLLMPLFQKELIKKGIIPENELYTQEEFDTNYEIRYRVRGEFQKEEGRKVVSMLVEIARERNFFLTRSFVESEFRRVKLNKMTIRLPAILENSDFCLIGALIPPYLQKPTEIVILKAFQALFQIISLQSQVLFLSNKASLLEREHILKAFRDRVPFNKGVFCDYWLRGFCEFEGTSCSKAHGIKDLSPEAYKIEEELNEILSRVYNKGKKKPLENELIKEKQVGKGKFGVRLKIESRLYRQYYLWQKELKELGLLEEEWSLEEISQDKEKKLALRAIIQKEIGKRFMKEVFTRSGRSFLPKV